jgi:hypothetical protein
VPFVVGLLSLVAIFFVLWDVFETVILPRRVSRRFRLTRLVYRSTWRLVSHFARRMASSNRRENLLAYYGPLILLFLLIAWASVLVVAYAGLQWAFGSQLAAPEGAVSFWTDLYLSGTTFFTLGLGDVVPRSGMARFLAVVEVANGFGLIAVFIGYLPAFYQSFSRREVNISLLDARAGSPPTAGELLRRHDGSETWDSLEQLLREWERWSAELMESHLSYPALAYFRSQHDSQSWVAAVTAILDVCALILGVFAGKDAHQAQLTFAIARHAVVDLSQVFVDAPRPPGQDRLSAADWQRLDALLAAVGATYTARDDAEARVREIRTLYEPYANALAEYLLMPLPPWLPTVATLDDWQTSATAHMSS